MIKGTNEVNLAVLIPLIEDKVLWNPDAASDFSSLPEFMRLDVLQQLVRITINPKAGKVLGEKHGFDLRGFRAMYFASTTQRIVYSVEGDGKCRIWGIGPRAGFAVYRTAAVRAGL